MLSNQELAKLLNGFVETLSKWSRTLSLDTLVVLFQPLRSQCLCISMK